MYNSGIICQKIHIKVHIQNHKIVTKSLCKTLMSYEKEKSL